MDRWREEKRLIVGVWASMLPFAVHLSFAFRSQLLVYPRREQRFDFVGCMDVPASVPVDAPDDSILFRIDSEHSYSCSIRYSKLKFSNCPRDVQELAHSTTGCRSHASLIANRKGRTSQRCPRVILSLRLDVVRAPVQRPESGIACAAPARVRSASRCVFS